jgi:DNA-binding NarL/FixJ family response regulator
MARILIADDRESMRRAIGMITRMRPGWEVCGEADDGQDAVEKTLSLKPDLVLLDFRMPLVNGIKAASAICSAMTATPVLMYTLHKTIELEVAARLAGIKRVVAKEEGPKSLLDAIEVELREPVTQAPARNEYARAVASA